MGFHILLLGFGPKLDWEMGFQSKLGWEQGFGSPLHDPLFRVCMHACMFDLTSSITTTVFKSIIL